MVRCALALLVALALGGTARAQEVDWSRSGGALFADRPEAPAQREAALTASPAPFAPLLDAAAERAGLDRKLLQALVAVESGFQAQAVSPAGAAGLTQLMPGTAAEFGVLDPFDPAENLAGGAAYLAAQIARFRDVRLALAAYNAGPARVARAGDVPPIPETRRYVESVVACVLAQMAGRTVRTARDCASEGTLR